MANLTFTKSGNLYVVTKQVNSNFALHLELADCGTITISQKSDATATKYDITETANLKAVLDYQYQGLVFPVDIKVESTKAVNVAIINEE